MFITFMLDTICQVLKHQNVCVLHPLETKDVKMFSITFKCQAHALFKVQTTKSSLPYMID